MVKKITLTDDSENELSTAKKFNGVQNDMKGLS